ncbi:MAG: imidazolonepropionase [Cyclobacteriaceae bacterium]
MSATQLLIGPFKQAITLAGLEAKGPIEDEEIHIIEDAGILVENGVILQVDDFEKLAKSATQVYEIHGTHVCIPGFVDSHTHICFGGTRARDYAARNNGKTYLEIAKEGGGIWDTVGKTRVATEDELVMNTIKRTNRHLKEGVTTIEVKSGYGLSVHEELKMLRAIRKASTSTSSDLISTCLAAHILPKDFDGDHKAYLDYISSELFPALQKEQLTNRIDAFIEEEAFSSKITTEYFQKAKELGFDITVHADQFSTGGSEVAVNVGAVSADHLEASGAREIEILAKSETVATALPGASMGLGVAFTPGRKILDAGGSLAIASDWNPGSAPMGDLLMQAAVLGSYEKLSNAEVLSGLTFRAAAALRLSDRGKLEAGMKADLAIFETEHYNEIFYHQGKLKPSMVFKAGTEVIKK